MRKRTQPTRAAAKKAMKRTKTAVVESSSSSSSPSSSESEHSELDRVNSDIDRVKEQVLIFFNATCKLGLLVSSVSDPYHLTGSGYT